MSPAESGHIGLLARLETLAAAIRTGQEVPSGRLLGLPELPEDDYWVDIAGAAAITGVQPSTITSWLSRGRPSHQPFPTPHRYLYRLYWPGAEIARWQTIRQSK